MGKIFISYRRADSEYVVGRIYEELCDTYGRDNVFEDIDSIPLGVDFREEISKVVHTCDILIAIIGENWSKVEDKSGKIRIQDSNDYVRVEIEEALKRNIPVIPIITSNAELPKEEDLPESLKKLAYHNAIYIRPDPDFKNDINRLKENINKIYKKPHRKIFIYVSILIISVLFVIYNLSSFNEKKDSPFSSANDKRLIYTNNTEEITRTLPHTGIPRYQIVYKGVDGVNIRNSPGEGLVLATAYYQRIAPLELISSENGENNSLWKKFRLTGWMVRRSYNATYLSSVIDDSSTVIWDGKGDPSDNYVSMRVESSLNSTVLARVYTNTKISILDTILINNREWVEVEIIGWMLTKTSKGEQLISIVE